MACASFDESWPPIFIPHERQSQVSANAIEIQFAAFPDGYEALGGVKQQIVNCARIYAQSG
jgi:hypothetical protein